MHVHSLLVGVYVSVSEARCVCTLTLFTRAYMQSPAPHIWRRVHELCWEVNVAVGVVRGAVKCLMLS